RSCGRRRRPVDRAKRHSADDRVAGGHRRRWRRAWLARLPAASSRNATWGDESRLDDGDPVESLARTCLLYARNAAPDNAANVESPLDRLFRLFPRLRVQSNRPVGARHDVGSLVAEHHVGYWRSAPFVGRVLADYGGYLRRARGSYDRRVTDTAVAHRQRTCPFVKVT